MKILVAGASGFLGSRLVTRLAAMGAEVIALARNSVPEELMATPRLQWVIGDIATQGVHFGRLTNVDAVVNVAGATLGAGEDEFLHLQANEQVTVRLLQAVASRTIRVVHASSQVVYGDPRHLAVTEDFPLLPDKSAYACSKVNSENWLRWFHGKYGGQYLALRFCGFIEGGGFIDYLIRQMLTGDQVELHSHGIVRRDYLPVDEAIDALVSALDYRGTGYLPVNIGSGQAVSALELANLISTELASCSRISLSETAAAQGDFVFCIDRARRTLNFSPSSMTSRVREYARRRWEDYKLSKMGDKLTGECRL